MECVRCGQCCIQAPCTHGRVRYRLKGFNPKCPALYKMGDIYYCKFIEEDNWMREIMVGHGCFYPQYRHTEYYLAPVIMGHGAKERGSVL